jgi:hypothetical protein
VSAAVVGAGSMVTASSAQAASSAVCIDAGGCRDCPACQFPCGRSGCCCCFQSVAGCCFCAENFFCGATHACHTDQDCPAGWGCVFSCCGSGTVCAPPCGTIVPNVTVCHNNHHGQPTATGVTAGTGQSVQGGGGGGHHGEPEAPAPPPHKPHGHG